MAGTLRAFNTSAGLRRTVSRSSRWFCNTSLIVCLYTCTCSTLYTLVASISHEVSLSDVAIFPQLPARPVTLRGCCLRTVEEGVLRFRAYPKGSFAVLVPAAMSVIKRARMDPDEAAAWFLVRCLPLGLLGRR